MILNLVSLETTAAAINIMMVVNTAIALRGQVYLVNREIYALTLIGILPGVPLGLWLLNTLTSQSTQLLQLALGVLVLFTGVMLSVRPKPRSKGSSKSSFAIAGALGGILGGLFSVPGPPVIYHFYMQPLAVEQVRLTLLGVFGTIALLRLTFLLANQGIAPDALYLGTLSIPVVAVATALLLKYPPALSEMTIRRCAFVLLSGMGIVILAVAWA